VERDIIIVDGMTDSARTAAMTARPRVKIACLDFWNVASCVEVVEMDGTCQARTARQIISQSFRPFCTLLVLFGTLILMSISSSPSARSSARMILVPFAIKPYELHQLSPAFTELSDLSPISRCKEDRPHHFDNRSWCSRKQIHHYHMSFSCSIS